MSYAITGQHPGLGIIASGDVCSCDGKQMCEHAISGDLGNQCCSWKTWTNSTYASLKGSWSLRRHNEKRVRKALRLLLEPVEGYGTGLDLAAWQAGAGSAPLDLFRTVERAAHNYHQLHPRSRWYKKSRGVRTDCESDGWYSQWKTSKMTSTHERVAALQNAVGSPLPEAWKSELLRRNEWNFGFPGKPSAVGDWQKRSNSTIGKVPGGSGGANIESIPIHENLIIASGSTIVPSAWLQSFLDAYAPRLKLKIALRPTNSRTAPRVSITALRPSLKLSRMMREPELEEDEDEPTMSTGVKAALGVGAVALIGAGFLVYRKR